MNDHDKLRSLLTGIASHLTNIDTAGHELIRRARIASHPDGYPRRASGAEPGDGLTSIRHDVRTFQADDNRSWSWHCSCAAVGNLHPNEYLATRAADDHANGTSVLDYADPTGEAATTPPQPDPLRADARRFLRLLATIEADLAAAALLATRPTIPTDNGDPGCESCARLTRHDGQPYWEPRHPKLKLRTTVGGRLPRPMWLCTWCYSQVGINTDTPGRSDILPTRDELAVHLAGKRIKRPA